MSGTENNVPAPKRSKRRWFVWLLLGVLGGAALYRLEPRVYRAIASVLIIPQRVPERFVEPTVTASLFERLNMIQQQVLSRSRLERIIQEFNLYERERKQLVMEDVIEQMRFDISINIAIPRNDDDLQSFSVSFDATEPRTAMRITERLASLFVQEAVEDRALLADQTEQFLQGQLEDARRQLLEIEHVLPELKRKGSLLLTTVTADHEVLLANYRQLLAHLQAAKLATSLERRQIGEQFKIIDGARLPEKPISPRLFPYLALGALAGLAAGIVYSIASWAWRRRRTRTAAA